MNQPRGKRADIQRMMEAFKVYRASAVVDYLDQLKLFAFVDGVVIEGFASVVSADPYGLVLLAERSQLTALDRARTVLLESPLHGASYRAEVDLVDHEKAFVSLHRLRHFGAYQDRRAYQRAAPGLPLMAQISGYGESASGRVADVSAHSLAVDVDPLTFSRVARAPLVRVDVWGEENATGSLPEFEVTAQVHRSAAMLETDERLIRAVLAFEPYPALARALRRYVARRQRDVLVELELEEPEATLVED